MHKAILARGTRYAGDTTFDPYTIVAEPLADAARRIFPGANGRPGVTYASHAIKLGRAEEHGRATYVILMEHGGGREVIALPKIHDNGVTLDALLALPEAALYGVLYAVWQTARAAEDNAQTDTARHWAQAYLENRIRKGRADRRGARTVRVAPREPGDQPASLTMELV